MSTHKEITLRALEAARGDDLYRARSFFANMTKEDMQLQYGEGKTRAEVLAEYEAHDKAISDAIEWVNKLGQ